MVLTEVIAENKRCLALCRGRGMGMERGGAEIVKQGSGRGEGVVDKRNYLG